MGDVQAKILYIAGWDRSGSTILDQILGQLPGFFSVGELVNLWGRGPNALCGCGSTIKDCTIWRQIFVEAYGKTPDTFDFVAGERYRHSCARARHLLLLSNPRRRRLLGPSLRSYLGLTGKLYRAIGSVTGAKVIIDSSKQPTYAYALGLAGMASPYILHLIRDPRGCAYSYQVGKAHPDPMINHMPLMNPAMSALHWIFANAATEALWSRSSSRYLLVRYEDFTLRPMETVERIVEFVGESLPGLPFASEHSVLLRPVHGVSGNPVRFRTGVVELQCDERWKGTMKRSHKLIVTALTGPGLSRYRYDQTQTEPNEPRMDQPVEAMPQARLELLGQRVMGSLLRHTHFTNGANRSRAVILSYHEIGYSRYGLLPERFAAQMQYLADHATVLTLEELLSSERVNGHSSLLCALTFDDGYAGVHDNALPILKRYGFPATIYLTTDAIHQAENARSDFYHGLDPGQRMLCWQQVHCLVDSGFSLGSHLCQHLDLSRLSPEEGWRQLARSREAIEKEVGCPCVHLAYPWGRFSLRSLDWVRAAGYQKAVTVVHRGLPRRLDPYRVPRLSINKDYTPEDFQSVLRGDWDYLAVLQSMRRPLTRLWRGRYAF